MSAPGVGRGFLFNDPTQNRIGKFRNREAREGNHTNDSFADHVIVL